MSPTLVECWVCLEPLEVDDALEVDHLPYCPRCAYRETGEE